MDVNQGADSPAQSSSANGQEDQSSNQAQDNSQSSAGTENTEKEWEFPEENPGWPTGVYNRFKEVNERAKLAKTYEEKLKTFESNSELYKTYEQFDQVLTQNPQLLQMIQQALQQENGQRQQQQPAFQGDPEIRTNAYVERFQRMASEKGINQDLIKDYFNETYHELLSINPDPIGNFRPMDVDLAFKNVMEREERRFKARQAGYLQNKQKDSVPASATKTGTAPVSAPKALNTQHERAQAMAEMIRARQY